MMIFLELRLLFLLPGASLALFLDLCNDARDTRMHQKADVNDEIDADGAKEEEVEAKLFSCNVQFFSFSIEHVHVFGKVHVCVAEADDGVN